MGMFEHLLACELHRHHGDDHGETGHLLAQASDVARGGDVVANAIVKGGDREDENQQSTGRYSEIADDASGR